jgi:dinuclear metal center YbgI/SA1388 family protein
VPQVAEVVRFLEEFAPPGLAEDWDNVGLLWGDRAREAGAVMTCLTLTPDVAAEAIDAGAGLVVTHHPILFRAVRQVTADSPDGRMLWELARAGVAVYSPHTSFDNTRGGINDQLAERFGLIDIEPLRTIAESVESPGSGRMGRLDTPVRLDELAALARDRLSATCVQFVGPPERRIERLGIACGSAAEFLKDAHRAGCDVFLTGEARFHACLEAEELGIGLVLVGHYASERPAIEQLAARLAKRFPNITTWPSQRERDPLTTLG